MTPLCSRSGRMLSKCLPIMCNAHELGVPVACRDEFACASRPSEELSSGFEIGWSSLQVGSSGSAVLYLSVPSWQLTHAHVGPGGGAGRPDPRPAEATTTPPDSLESPIQGPGRVATPGCVVPLTVAGYGLPAPADPRRRPGGVTPDRQPRAPLQRPPGE